MNKPVLVAAGVIVILGWATGFRVVQIMPAEASQGWRTVAGFGLQGFWIYDDVMSRCNARRKDTHDQGYDPINCEGSLTEEIDKKSFVKTIWTAEPEKTAAF
ncbi:hypothetical protein HJA76_09760 [Rhizobium bangladeshense]|uniref:hypothetical protein n=1 Tax=Rhizobium bangladeshense TaxID=1138189 RepID=UPI001C83E464|nr:hypothetical protein [Rhizobium bangladeshense]MBX4919993.1 hypothetical protein [Rhizobium bangladeshense]